MSGNRSQRSNGGALARNSAVIGGLTLLSRVLGLFRDIVIARQFGAGGLTDAFFVALRVPNMLRRLVADGALASAFVPVLTEEEHRSRSAAVNAFRETFVATAGVSLFFTIFLLTFSYEIIAILSPGLGATVDGGKAATSLLRIMAPFIFFISLTAIVGSTLNVLGKFALPTLTSSLLNICIICAATLPSITSRLGFEIANTQEWPISALGWGVLIGGIVGLVPALVQLWRLGFTPAFSNPFRSRPVRRLTVLMVPSVVSAAVYQLSGLVMTMLASTLGPGAISWLYYAERVFQFPLGVYSVALGTAALPLLSRVAMEGDAELSREFARVLRWVLFVTIPATVGLVALAHPITTLLFDHGEFSGLDQTGMVLAALAVGLTPISIQGLTARVYLARKNTSVPATLSIAGLILHIVLALLLTGPGIPGDLNWFGQYLLKVQERCYILPLGFTGIALSASLAAIVAAAAMLALLPRIGVRLPWGQVFRTGALTGIASAVMYGVIHFLDVGTDLSAEPLAIFGILAGILTFGVAALLLGMEEAVVVKQTLSKQLARIGGKK